MHKVAILAVLLAASFAAGATNNPPNECGNHGNNCQPSGGDSNANSSSGSSSSAGAVGVGVGVGLGGAGGNGGAGGSGGSGGSGGFGYGGSAVGLGGAGGDASSAVLGSGNSHNANTAKGGDASQGQLQGQQQSNVGLNSQGQSSRNDNTNVSKSVAQQALENSNRIDASSQNANNSQASGNTTVTNVGGDSTLVERNAPPVFLGAITPTSCGGSIQAGASDRNGSGAFGFSWVGTECSIRMLGDRYQQLGMVDTACEVYRSTKAFQKAAKRNPALASLDCRVKPAPAPAPVLVAPELAPRIPRG